ncbi:MAG: arylesterase [Candidatus Contendobacter odensis]|uniref:Arylesterase n=1 Tax=Candidatus Contendibacter odensensis TaxID=1400860 RepID=A0A2G6PHH4_9GAMM|nr:MAG: arylesterase [Candidatus Contendobacter odensis]
MKTNCLRWLLLLLPCLVPGYGIPVHAKAPVILVLGDSLSAAYGLSVEHGWVNLLQQRLAKQGYPHKVINASISGDTSSGGLSRLPVALAQHHPGIVIIELGANDGLRGQPPMLMAHNLAKMITLSQQINAHVLLAEMRIPPNYGALYAQKFQDTFREVAKQHTITLIPFLLNGVAGQPALIQADGLHPTAEAQPRILDNVWPVLEPVLNNNTNE